MSSQKKKKVTVEIKSNNKRVHWY